MASSLKGKDFITTQEWSIEELTEVLDFADELKRQRKAGEYHDQLLRACTLYMLFFFASTRTRNSFETAMTQLGGHGIFLDPSKTQISHGEGPKDTGTILGRYGEGIAVRHCDWGEGNQYLRALAQHSENPVINMQCDQYHPCQIMADYMTIRERFGKDTRGLKVGVSWTSAPNYVRPISVPQSLILLLPRFGCDVTLAYPPEFKLVPQVEEQARKNAEAGGGKFKIVNEFEPAFEDANVVIPKSWGPLMTISPEMMEAGVTKKPSPEEEVEAKKQGLALIEKYPAWRCEKKHMDLCASDGIYMHPLPADRGREVTDEVIDGPRSAVYDEAENRLHVQKALLAKVLG